MTSLRFESEVKKRAGKKRKGKKTAFNILPFVMDKSSYFSAGISMIRWLIKLGKIDGNTLHYRKLPVRAICKGLSNDFEHRVLV